MKAIVTVLYFRNAKQQMESLSEQPVRLRFFKLCKNQSFETNRSDLHGVKNLVHTCMRWILIHLNSEFDAMLS